MDGRRWTIGSFENLQQSFGKFIATTYKATYKGWNWGKHHPEFLGGFIINSPENHQKILTNSDIHRCKRARGYLVTRHRSSHSIAFVQNQRMSKRCGPLPVAGWNLRILVHGHAGSILECRFMILKVYSPKIVPLWSKFIKKKRNTIGPLAYLGGTPDTIVTIV